MKRNLSREGICFEPLEPRLLLSGTWGTGADGPVAQTQADLDSSFNQATVAATTAAETSQSGAMDGGVDLLGAAPALDLAAAADTDAAPISEPTDAADSRNATSDDFLPEEANGQSVHELVIVNDNVAGYEQLVADLQAGDGDRIIDVAVLEADGDGIQQVSEILAQYSDLEAVHFIAHGADGRINIGGAWLNDTSLSQYEDAVSDWGKALNENGDMLFYGCNIASGSAGQSLLNLIAGLTGADVAASDDLTGSTRLGGDWDLEFVAGTIETQIAVDAGARAEWEHLLDVPTANDDNLSTSEDTPLTIDAASDLLANDTDTDGDTPILVDQTDPANGTLVDNGDGTLTYTPDADYNGTDSFDYMTLDDSYGLAHYWGLDGSATDNVGTADGTLVNGPTTVAGTFGNGLSFDETDDYVQLPDVTYTNEFTLSFDFKIDDNSGTGYQFLYSHGPIHDENGLNIGIGESDNSLEGNALFTNFHDSNDDDGLSTSLDIDDISATGLNLIGTGWHTYTLVVSSAGSSVYIDGSLQTTSTNGGDAFDPAADLYFGRDQAGTSNRYCGSSLDSVKIFNKALSDPEVSGLYSAATNVAVANITVDPVNDAPEITSPAAVNVVENQTAVTTVTATDADGDTPTFSITGGADQGRFNINPTTGNLAFNSPPNYEAPSDANSDGIYEVQVTANDGNGGTVAQTILVTVTDMAELPTVNVPTGATIAEDPADPLEFSIANSNRIWLSNIPASDPAEVELSVPSGVLTLSGTTGLTFSLGDGTGDSAMIFSGTAADINAALDGLSFQLDVDYNGNLQIEITAANMRLSTTEPALVGHYSFEITTDAGDDSSPSGGNDATVNGDATVVTDPTRGNVLEFDGDGDSLQVAGHLGVTNAVTLAGWVNLDGYDTNGAEIFSMGDDIVVRLSPDGTHDKFTIGYYNGTNFIQTSAWLDTGFDAVGRGWFHLAYTVEYNPVDGKTYNRFYVDGQYEGGGSSNNSGFFFHPGRDTYIGTHGNGAAGYDFDGRMDEVSIFDRALSQDEITALVKKTTAYVDVQVTAVNDAPVLSSLGDTAAFTEDGPAVVLDTDVTVNDVELDALNGGLGDYDGASLALARDGGPFAEDTFSFTDGNGISLSGGNLIKNSQIIATFNTTAVDGRLTITFTHDNGEIPTSTDVNNILRQITYANSSDMPPASAQIHWMFYDGNTGAQGSGGVLTDIGFTTVNITAVNDAPQATNLNAAETYTEDTPLDLTDIVVSDVDSANVTVTLTLSDAAAGTLSTGTSGAVTATFAGGVWTASGAVADVNTLLAGVTFTPASNYDSNFSIATSVDDGVAPAVTGSKAMTANPVNNTPSFTSGDGVVMTDFGNGHDGGRSVTIQDDGKVLVAGYSYNGTNYDFALVRYNPDGSLDTSFGGGDGMVTTDIGGVYDYGCAIELLADGSILVGGYTSNGEYAVVRYTSDGNLDTAFGSGGIAAVDLGSGANQAFGIAVQSTGHILISGIGNDGGAYNDFALVRFDSDGNLDTGFGSGGILMTDFAGESDWGRNVVVQSDDKILVGGRREDGDADFAVVRYNSDGTLDTSFGVNGLAVIDVTGSHDMGYDIALQADGKIVQTGYAYGTNKFILARYNADGSLDTSFGGGAGFVITDVGGPASGIGITVQADGKILVDGFSNDGSQSDFALVRYNSDGSLDTGFGDGTGIVITDVGGGNDFSFSVAVQPDGGIVVAGQSFNGIDDDFALVRYNRDGKIDSNFGNTLNGTPTYIEDGAAVVLDADVTVSDAELDALNGGLGNYDGASLTLLRNGGANAEDTFSFNDGNGITLSGGNLIKNAQIIATFDTTAAGQLVITFTDAGGEIPTSADVANILRQITYANSSDAPPASVQIDWTLNDGNTGSQGSGGALTATGSTTVSITAVNDAPQATNLNAAESYTEDTPLDLTDIVVSDVDSANVTVTLTLSDAAAGTLSTGTSGAVTSTFAGGVWTASGAIADVNTLLASITFTPAANYNSNFSIATSVDDGVAPAVTGSKAMTATAVNDAPVLDNSGAPQLTTITEDETGNVGNLVSEIIGSVSGDMITDADSGALEGIAITGLSNMYGSGGWWEYNTGSGWTAVGAVSDAQSLLLGADDRLRFVPDGERYDIALVTFKAWDQTSGIAGTKVNTSVSGGTTAFSSEEETAQINVASVNDAPTVANAIPDQTATEDAVFNFQFAADTFDDVDVGDSLTYTAPGLPAWLSFDAATRTFTGTPANGDVGTVTITVRATDDGGAYVEDTFEIAVANTNDAPTATNLSAAETYTEDTALNLTDIVVSDVDSTNVTVTLTLSDAAAGTLSTGTSGAVTATFAGGVWTASGAVADVNTLLAGLTFTPNLNYNSNFSIATSVDDGVAPAVTGSKAMTAIAVNSAPSFTSGNGVVTTDFGNGNDEGRSVTIQDDGKVLVVGYSYNGTNYDFALVRYNPDGSLDTSFGGGDGMVTTDIGGVDDYGRAIELLADGSILVGGYTSDGEYAVVRYTSDGNLDTAFGSGGIAAVDLGSSANRAFGISVQSTGHILISGIGNDGGAYNDFALVRFDSDGNLDTGFGSGGILMTDFSGESDWGRNVVVQSDDKILVGGRRDDGDADFAVVRYNSDGTLDTSFGVNGLAVIEVTGSHDMGYDIALQADGKIVQAGYVYGTKEFILARYNADGSPDTSFGGGAGFVITDVGGGEDFAFGITIQADGKILVDGYSNDGSQYDFALVRYNSDGSLDTGFGGGTGIVITDVGGGDDYSFSVAVQPDGGILVAGHSFNGVDDDFALVRYNSDGTIDSNFGNTLNGTPTYIEDGAAVVLDADVTISDADLDALNGGLGNYDGAGLTLLRNGGANAEDVFFFNDGNGITLSGTDLLKGGEVIATFDTTTPGQLVISFTQGATQIATSADVDNILRQITYANSSDAPPVSVQIDWTFNDGNTGLQGSGGALTATGSTTVSITPVDDPSVLMTDSQTVAEDTTTTGNVLTNDSDVDDTLTVTTFTVNGDATVYNAGDTAAIAGVGTLEILADGSYTFTPAADWNGTVPQVTYTTNTGSSITLNITVNPVDDAAVIGGVDTSSVTEDVDPDSNSLLEVVGALTITDPDAGEASFQASTIAGVYGSLTIDAAGNWNYSADNLQAAIQQLDAGESINDVLAVTAADGTIHNITITITGSEDMPIISGAVTGAVTRDATLTAGGTLTIADADAGDNPIAFNPVAATTGDNGYGSFVLAGGAWTYNLNNAHAAVQGLYAGNTLTDTITFIANDGSTCTVTVTINGAGGPGPGGTGGTDPDPGGDPDPVEPEPELPPEEILPPVEEVVPPTPPDIPPPPPPDNPTENPSGANDDGSTDSDSVIPDKRSPSDPAALLEYLHGSAPKTARVVPSPGPFFSPEALSLTLDRVQQQLDLTLPSNAQQDNMIIGMATGLGVSVFAGYVIWAFRGASLLFGALSAMPMWRCFDPMPVLIADDKEREQDQKKKKTRPEPEDDEDDVKNLLGSNVA